MKRKDYVHGMGHFISYAHEDRSRTAPLVTLLETEGFSAFPVRKLAPGTEWRHEIGAGLEVVPCILVIWSKHQWYLPT